MSSFTSYADHNKEVQLADEADAIEWKAINLGTCPISGSEIDNIVVGDFIEAQSRDEAKEATQRGSVSEKMTTEKIHKTQKREELVTGIKKELVRRQQILGESYPFLVEANSIKYLKNYDESMRYTYEFLLRTAVAPSREDREIFEDVVTVALKNYLGVDRAKSSVFGWQSLDEHNQPSRIKEKFNLLSEDSGEWDWMVDSANGFTDDPAPALVKDMGLDVVVWLPSVDNRIGKIFLVAQCATGKSNWQNKLHDVSWTRISNWIRPVPQEWTIRCFAIPFHLPNHAHFVSVSREGGMFFDRSRLTLLLQGSQRVA